MNFEQELWHKFTEKINAEWQKKYSHFGISIKKIKGTRVKFTETVSEDIKKLTGEKISAGTLNRYFTAHGLGENPQRGKLDILSMYVGYKDFDDFKQKIEIEKIKEIKKSDQKTEPEKVLVVEEILPSEPEIKEEILQETKKTTDSETIETQDDFLQSIGVWVFGIIIFFDFAGWYLNIYNSGTAIGALVILLIFGFFQRYYHQFFEGE